MQKEGAVAAAGRRPRPRSLPRRHRTPLPRPRLRRLDAGPAVGGRPGQRVPALVLERAPRRRLQVAAGHGRLRGGPRQRAPLRPAAGRWRRRRDPGAQHHRGHQPPGLPAGPGPRRRGGHHGGRAPRQPAALGAGGDAALGGMRHRAAPSRRPTSCGSSTTAGRPALLALTGASNVTGWLPPVEEICAEAHARGVPVLLDAAQLAPHRPLPTGPDFVAFSGHKLYAPFGAGALHRAPARSSSRATRSWPAAARSTWSTWTRSSGRIRPSARRPARPTSSARSPSGTAMDELERIGWETITAHEHALSSALVRRLARHRRRARARAVVRVRRAATGWRWPRSRWTACTTPWWRRG